jgi:hypothetical protein
VSEGEELNESSSGFQGRNSNERERDCGKGITRGIAGLVLRISCVLILEDNNRMAFKK